MVEKLMFSYFLKKSPPGNKINLAFVFGGNGYYIIIRYTENSGKGKMK